MKKRLLALMMALAMVLPILSIGAWADETADEEELLLVEELELTEEETEEAAAEESIEVVATETEAEGADLPIGFAIASEAGVAVYGADQAEALCKLAGGAIVLATETTNDGWMHIAWNYEGVIANGFVPADAIRLLTDEELEAYLDSLADSEVVMYGESMDYPLGRVAYVEETEEASGEEAEAEEETTTESTATEAEEETTTESTATETEEETTTETTATETETTETEAAEEGTTSTEATGTVIPKGSWRQDSRGWWYRRDDGSYPKNKWEQIDGAWYHFDANGYRQTGWLKLGTSWYYLASDGKMKTGWVKVGSSWYYLNKSGVMQTGWVKVGSSWYYLNKSGVMQTGWLQLGTTWYYLKGSGVMQTGWLNLDGAWYWFKKSGVRATDVSGIDADGDGCLYAFDADGKLWQAEIDKVTYDLADGEFTVSGYTGNSADVAVVGKIKDMPITAIGEKAFEGNASLVSISLPNSINVIGKRAFADCVMLSSSTTFD